MKKKLLSTLLLVFALTIATFAFVFAGCNKDKDDKPSSTAGSYYLSVLEGDTWTKYSSDSAVPAAYKFAKDGGVYKLTVDLEEGDSVKIAQVGKSTTYGGEELFSSETQLTAGSDNAIAVGETGKYVLSFDASDSTISYSFTPAGSTANVVSVAIDAEEITLGINGTKQLTATATLDDETTTDEGITWEIDDTTVATVSESGLVTAVAEGSTFVVAKCGDVESDPVVINVTSSIAVSTIAFEHSTYAIGLTGTLTVSASVNSDATNQNVIYSTSDTGISIDGDGNVTATAIGVYTVTAKAAGDATKTATATITVYPVFYICGEASDWAGLINGETTTVGTAYENFTFTPNEDYTEFTLVLNNIAKFQILYLGGGWSNAITGEEGSCTLNGASADSQNNIVISGTSGVYTVTIEDVYSGTPTVTASRTGDIPSFTATINGESGTSTPSHNRYEISVDITLASAVSTTDITISGAATSSYTHAEDLEAGNYRFNIVCDTDGQVVSVTVEPLQDSWVVAAEYNGVEIYYNTSGSWGTDTASGVVAYYNSSENQYKLYFSYEIASDRTKFSFGILKNSAWACDLKSNSAFTNTPTISTSKIEKANAEKFNVKETGSTVYFEVVFTVSGDTYTFVSLTASDTDLNV